MSKDIFLIKGYSISMRDENGEVIYTFPDEDKRDEFYDHLVRSDVFKS